MQSSTIQVRLTDGEWNSEHRRYEMSVLGFKVHSVFQSINDADQNVFGYERRYAE